MAWKWQGKVALVTGVSAGIGEAIVRELVARGTHVVGCARRLDKMEKLREELKTNEGDFYPVQCDLKNSDSIAALFERAREIAKEKCPEVGCVQILVNNAGLGHKTSLIDGNPEHWEEMFDLNVHALAKCTKIAVSDMLESDAAIEGHVVHVSSISGHRVSPESPNSAVYCATKFAVRAMAEGLRMELVRKNSKIRVTHLCPGLVKTEFAETFNGKKDDAFYDEKPHLTSKDVADACTYVLDAPEGVSVSDLVMRHTSARY